MLNIVIAVQQLPRGVTIPPNAVDLRPWPEAAAPQNALTNVEDVIGKIARTDIQREQPILSTYLVEDLANLARVGSDAAAVLPSGLVAVSVPMDRITSVAYAVQDGDRVDVMVSLLFVDVDEGFQSLQPNLITLFSVDPTDRSLKLGATLLGRPENTSLGVPGIITPSERQRPRLVTQRTIQDALVVHVGDFPIDGKLFRFSPPTPTPAPTVEGAATPSGQATVAPTEVPARPDIITLGVTPQDAVVLTWYIEAKLPITFALRSAKDTSKVPTDPVTLQYIMQQYRIDVPGKTDFSIQPPITSIRQLIAGNQISLNSSSTTGGGQ
jgi:pilus assembly protein CpaB